MARWNRPESYTEWQNALDNMQSFVIKRSPLMLEILNAYFGNPFTVFPNPSANQTTLHFYSLNEHFVPTVHMTDNLGRAIDPGIEKMGLDYTLDLTGIPAGLYMIRVDMGHMNYATRLIKTSD